MLKSEGQAEMVGESVKEVGRDGAGDDRLTFVSGTQPRPQYSATTMDHFCLQWEGPSRRRGPGGGFRGFLMIFDSGVWEAPWGFQFVAIKVMEIIQRKMVILVHYPQFSSVGWCTKRRQIAYLFKTTFILDLKLEEPSRVTWQ